MKQQYLNMMELALSAYTRERDYIREVRQGGLTEHSFPRLGVWHRYPRSQWAKG